MTNIINKPEPSHEDIIGKTEFKKQVRKDRKQLGKLLAQSKKEDWEKFCSEVEKTKTVARLSKILESRSTNLGSMSKEDGSYTSNPKESVTLLADTLLGKDNKQKILGPKQADKTYNNRSDLEKLDKFINKHRIKLAIKDSKDKKAPGKDNIYNEILKMSCNIIVEPLLNLFQNCISRGHTPVGWQTSNGAILRKPGKTDYSKAKSFRIITLTSNFLKTLETLVLWHMKDDLKIEETMTKNQYGFKKGSSCDAALLKLIDKIQSTLKYKRHALGIFIDIEGAFDKVPHQTIKNAVDKTKAKGMISDWIFDMITHRKINLSNADVTINKQINMGCPQGGVLSPFLWNIVLNPLLKKLNMINQGQAFADDLNITISGDDPFEIFKNAKNTIDFIENWCNENGLTISEGKTNAMFWTRARKLEHPNHIMVGKTKVKLTNSLKYLGVYIDNKLKFTDHITNMVTKTKNVIFAAKKAIGKKWGLKPHMIYWLYKTIIIPKITYGCIAWGINLTQSQARKIGTIQTLAQSLITRCRNGTSKAFLNVFLNMTPLKDKIIETALKRSLSLKAEGHWNADPVRPDPFYFTNHKKSTNSLKAWILTQEPKQIKLLPLVIYLRNTKSKFQNATTSNSRTTQ